MRYLFALAVLACLTITPACKTTPTSPPGPVVAGVIDCTTAEIREKGPTIMPTIATALATGDYEAELLKFVASYGEGVVDCVVAKLVANAEADLRASTTDRQAPVRAANGKAWLAKRGVTFAAGGGQ